MTDPKQVEQWRNVGLRAGFAETRDMLHGMIAQYWPETVGRVFIREYNLPNGTMEAALAGGAEVLSPAQQREVADKEAYVQFVERAVMEVAGQSGTPPEEGERAKLRIDAGAMFDGMLNIGYGLQANQAGNLGGQQTHVYVLNDEKAGPIDVPVSVINIGATGCAHCGTSMKARIATPGQCEIATPDKVLADRMDYFMTSVHEMAHAVNRLDPAASYETPAEIRREESTTRVFELLMMAKVFGEPGRAKMREELYTRTNAYEYEALDATKAAIEIAHRPGGLDAYNPRQLLTLAQELVDTHDATLKLSPEAQQDYKKFVEREEFRIDEVKERLTRYDAAGPTERFNLTVKGKHKEGQKPDGSDNIVSFEVPYTPIMIAHDRNVVEGNQIGVLNFRRMGMFNPLRPAGQQGQQGYTLFSDTDEAAKALEEFNRGINHPSCDIPAAILEAQQKFIEEDRKRQLGIKNEPEAKDATIAPAEAVRAEEKPVIPVPVPVPVVPLTPY